MSTHPNVVLKLVIKPDGTTRKLHRDLLAENREEVPDSNLPPLRSYRGDIVKDVGGGSVRLSRDDDDPAIGDYCYHTLVMEDDYDDHWQISGEEGDLIVFDLVTYGYGEDIAWAALRDRVSSLETWAAQRGLTYTISVSANYW